MTKEIGFILGRSRLYFPPAKVQTGPGAHPAYQLPSIKRYHPGSNTARARSWPLQSNVHCIRYLRNVESMGWDLCLAKQNGSANTIWAKTFIV